MFFYFFLVYIIYLRWSQLFNYRMVPIIYRSKGDYSFK